jgi:hypothetical protein
MARKATRRRVRRRSRKKLVGAGVVAMGAAAAGYLAYKKLTRKRKRKLI